MNKCPGADWTQKEAQKVKYDILCPGCNYEIEFWFNDFKKECPQCKQEVEAPLERIIKSLENFSCIRTCSYAKTCFGELYDLYERSILDKDKKD